MYNTWLQIFVKVSQATSNSHTYLKSCWPIQKWDAFYSTTYRYKIYGFWLIMGQSSFIEMLNQISFEVCVSMLNNWPTLKVCHLPHKASARSLFSKNSYTRRRCVRCKQHPFNFTRFLCVMPVMETTSFKKSSMPWWDLVVNNFTATVVPSTKHP